ncbi:MAG: thiamine pyridinylase [Gammaproteobacteria bacterium]|nr:thiamine pyridinylase [Gammaproteobacteria bacterium]
MKYFKQLILIVSLALTTNIWAETLKVGLYPYVPRVNQFKEVLEEKWHQLYPEIQLEVITDMSIWDGGYDTNPEGLDVFVFDALFLNKYRDQAMLEPLKASDINPDGLNDFVPYAINGVMNSDGVTYAGIPIFGCTNVLFYKKGIGVKDANTFDEVRDIVKTCQFTGILPGQPPHNGMMLDISGKTTNASYYVATQYAMNGVYPFPTPTSINSDVTNRLQNLMTMSSYNNANNSNLQPYQRGIWFGRGHGNSFVGFTESMWGIAQGNNDRLPDDFGFKALPLWNDGEATNPVFYADVIGVNANGKNIDNAKKLAALLGSKDLVVASSTGQGQSGGVPQYLLLTLKSAYDELATDYPIYSDMKTMASNPNIKLFSLSDSLYKWFNDNKSQIRTDNRAGFSCGCDKATEIYLTSANATTTCTPLCESQGGWNGQWTTASPYVPAGSVSVCACKACATP